jgi:hypothetical protein
MIQERVRPGLGRAVEGGKRLGRPSTLKNESKANYGLTRAFWGLPGLAVSALAPCSALHGKCACAMADIGWLSPWKLRERYVDRKRPLDPTFISVW